MEEPYYYRPIKFMGRRGLLVVSRWSVKPFPQGKHRLFDSTPAHIIGKILMIDINARAKRFCEDGICTSMIEARRIIFSKKEECIRIKRSRKIKSCDEKRYHKMDEVK